MAEMYSKSSRTRTPMVRVPWLIRTCIYFCPQEIISIAQEKKYLGIFQGSVLVLPWRCISYVLISITSWSDAMNSPLLINAFRTIYCITKSCLYNFDTHKPQFYIVKLGFKGVYIIFLISVQKHRLLVLVRTASSRRF